MTIQHVVFIILSAIALIGALGVVLDRRLFRSALFLVLSFVGVAGFYILLEVELLAMIQLLIYVGAIAILIIFAIMLSRQAMIADDKVLNEQWAAGWLAAVALFAALVYVLVQVNWPVVEAAAPANGIQRLGETLMNPDGFVLPFEIASVLLLVALVGAVIIAREK
ncbi:MAG: NADH-quinone oxidoreductase subunit J [Anaerolineae bacterium]|nr:NADH-quinone oxidoreductase subunit J [Anaerolineae bacterium]